MIAINQNSNATASYFKLLIPATKPSLANNKIINLCGEYWELVEFEEPSDTPPYTCISYSWQLGDDQKISDRTIPSFETVTKALQSKECLENALRSMFHGKERFAEKSISSQSASSAIWIDSLCCPQEQSKADLCIQNMGEIYRNATQVFVVLSAYCDNTILKIHNEEPLNIDDYIAIVNDDWIDRIWTYQEFANSKMMFIVAEDRGEIFISELQFLNALMSDDTAYADIEDVELFQKLERMQLLIAEQQIGERSAFQVMSSIQERKSSGSEARNRINVMLSVLTNASTITYDQNLTTLVEHFMHICEEKSDFSFIFSTNERSNISGKEWRPIGEQITPVISNVLTFGRGLSGSLEDTHLQMHNMCRMLPWKTNTLIRSIENFIKTNFPQVILSQLRQRGFTGCGECINLEYGYFFPQSPHKRSSDLFVAISHDVKFQQGAPALLLRSTDTDINQFCDIGVFIGKAPDSSETINVS